MRFRPRIFSPSLFGPSKPRTPTLAASPPAAAAARRRIVSMASSTTTSEDALRRALAERQAAVDAQAEAVRALKAAGQLRPRPRWMPRSRRSRRSRWRPAPPREAAGGRRGFRRRRRGRAGGDAAGGGEHAGEEAVLHPFLQDLPRRRRAVRLRPAGMRRQGQRARLLEAGQAASGAISQILPVVVHACSVHSLGVKCIRSLFRLIR